MSIRCVKLNKVSDNLMQASKEVEGAKLSIEWITEDKATQLAEKDNCMYICDPFEGAAFEHIQSLGCRIIGPQCVLSCLSLKIPIPKTKHPIYSMAMKDIQVCCSNIERKAREQIHTKVQWMGGHVTKTFNELVTHLVVGEVGSKKYHVAASLNKAIVLPEWVNAVYEACQQRHVEASDPMFDCYKCPVFKGCVICVTGLESADRKDVKRLTEKNGGRYMGELKFNECTHLIVNTPKGQKYDFAQRWKIHCISLKWFKDSVEMGACQDENLYIVEVESNQDERTSTPNGTTTKRLSSVADVSSISYVDVSKVDETVNSTMNVTTAFNEVKVQDPLNSLDLYKPPDEEFLDSCKIYLSGFTGSRLEKVRKIINTGGGTRFSHFTENVTHVVVETGTEDHIELITSSDYKPEVVTVEWLVECFKQTAMVSEQPYICLDVPTTCFENLKIPVETVKDKKKPAKKVSSVSIEDQEDDVMLQYLDKSTRDYAGNKKSEEEEEDDDDDATQIQQDIEVDVPDEELENGIFTGKKFTILEFLEDEEEEITNMINAEGGIVISTSDNSKADYQIVPNVVTKAVSNICNVATNCWLQKCMEFQEVYQVSSHPLYLPILLDLNKKPLKDCVLTVSQYIGVERDCLLHIATLLGATCQEYLSRKAKNNVKANTHLLLKDPEGTKYDAAKKWKIPAVGIGWILECAQQCRHADEDNYLIDNQECTGTVQSTNGINQPDGKRVTPQQNLQEMEVRMKEVVEQNVDVEEKEEMIHVEEKKQELSEDVVEKKNWQVQEMAEDVVENEKEEVLEMAEDVAENEKEEVLEMAEDVEENENQHVQEMAEVEKENQDIEEEMVTEEEKEDDDDEVVIQNLNNVTDFHEENVTKERFEKSDEPIETCERLPNKSTTTESDDLKTPKAVNRRHSELQRTASTSSPNRESPSVFLAPGYRPKFIISEELKNFLKTPPNERKKSRKSNMSIDDFLKGQLQIALKNSVIDQRSDDVFEECSSSQNDDGVLKGVIICVSMKLSKKFTEYNRIATELGADFRWTYDDGCTHFIYQGKAKDSSKELKIARQQQKYIVSPHWLFACQEERVNVDVSLYPHTYNPKLSLTVSKTPVRSNRRSTRKTILSSTSTTPAVKKATKEKGIDLAPPASKMKQSDSKSTKDQAIELAPPASKMEQSVSASKSTVMRDTITDEELLMIDAMEQQGEEKGVEEKIGELKEENKMEKEGSLEEREDFQKQIEQLMTSTMSNKGGSKRRSRRLNTTSSTGNDSDSGLNNSGSTRRPRSKMMTTITEKNESKSLKGHSSEIPIEASQNIQITWDDPTGREVRKEIMEQLQRSSSPTRPQKSSDESETSENNSNTTVRELMKAQEMLSNEMDNEDKMLEEEALRAPPIRLPHAQPPVAPAPLSEEQKKQVLKEKSPPVFMMSSLRPQEKLDYAALIEQLGGIVKDATYFDKSTTHLIVGQPSRNEKYLSALSTGRWILHKSYLEACRDAQHFVEEDIHEWGSPLNSSSLRDKKIAKLALPASRWRKTIQEDIDKDGYSDGAFGSWRVLLCVNKSKEGGFKRLLETGGAKILAACPPFKSNHYVDATHAFITTDHASQVDIKVLVDHNIMCLKAEYIAEFLMQHPEPNPCNYLCKGAIEIMKRNDLEFRKRKTDEARDSPSKKTRLN
ncbi:DNA topoisomerase 2-binding protein 1-like isoform X2 [Antedon mediterranea]|uniref:DNA topoisomerase 2-binding protein 1-like isoform X2 n=1 Tax=Antedon mediterranea TaxID=105859 RepID=UPI003AF8EB1C